jgi:ectoine hydroxylase-related dioxygenase (phytanoyl-CoA dioxygenase family)
MSGSFVASVVREEFAVTDTAVVTQLRRQFAQDGVVHVPGVLNAEWLELAALGIKRNVTSPGPYAVRLYEGTEREIYLDYLNYRVIPEWQILVRESPICATVAEVLDSEELWLFFEQIWLKEGGETRRTAWHQDATTWLTGGNQVCGCWITLDPLEARHSLEFVRGSHLGPLYGGTQLDKSPYDDTAPVYAELPRMPDIESERDAFDIVSFPNEPGDIVIFHPAVLHGGGAGPGRRRTLSLRFFGDDVTYSPRLGRPSPPYPGVPSTHQPGQPLRSYWFPKVYPVHE